MKLNAIHKFLLAAGIAATLSSVGCKLDDNRLKGRVFEREPAPPPIVFPDPPANLSISSNDFLGKVTFIESEGLEDTAIDPPWIPFGGLAPSLSGLSVATEDVATTVLALPGLVEPVPKQGNGLDASPIFSADYTAEIQIHGDWNNSFNWSCQAHSPYSELSCSPPQLTLPSYEMTPIARDIQVELFHIEEPTISSHSQSLPLSFLQIRQISNISGDLGTDSPNHLFGLEDDLFFSAYDADSFYSWIYRYDSTDNTISRLTENLHLPFFSRFIAFKDDILFLANRGCCSSKLVAYHRPTGQIRRISNTINNNSDSDFVSPWTNAQFVEYKEKLYFPAINLRGSWVTKPYAKTFVYSNTGGTDTDSITQVLNTTGNQDSTDYPKLCGVYNNKLFLVSNNSLGADKIYSYEDHEDGSGTLTQVSNTRGDNAEPDQVWFCGLIVNDKLFFRALNAHGAAKLFYYQEPEGQVVELSNTSGDPATQEDPRHLFSHNNQLFFSALNPEGASKLHVYDGDKIVQISNTSGDSAVPDHPVPRISYRGDLYFYANTPQGGRKLFRFNSDEAEIQQITNTRQDQSANDFSEVWTDRFAVYNERLYFWAINELGAGKLFVYDGVSNSLAQVSNTRGDNSLHDKQTTVDKNLKLSVFKDRLYFAAHNLESQVKLFALCDTDLDCE